jgi:hypothetical protein
MVQLQLAMRLCLEGKKAFYFSINHNLIVKLVNLKIVFIFWGMMSSSPVGRYVSKEIVASNFKVQ